MKNKGINNWLKNKFKNKIKTNTIEQPLCWWLGGNEWNDLPFDPFPNGIHYA
jgi:hypothetical protein